MNQRLIPIATWGGLASLFLFSLEVPCLADEELVKKGWPESCVKVRIESSLDSNIQPAVVSFSKARGKRPLLVGLHTWSGGFDQGGGETVYAKWCKKTDWHFIHPHFRGPNWTPQAMGSKYAVQDILDAVKYMQDRADVDPDRIYLVGVSGGGYMSLLMAGRAPRVWAGVSAWCSISDIEEWWKFHAFKDSKYAPGGYARHIEKSVGGRPDSGPATAKECLIRSPVHWLDQARSVNLDINHGILDGRNGSVPFVHSLHAFNRLAIPAKRIPAKTIDQYYRTLTRPQGLQPPPEDPLYGKHKIRFRRISGNTRVTLFQGGHEIVHSAALNWLARQRRGQQAVWIIPDPIPLASPDSKKQSGK